MPNENKIAIWTASGEVVSIPNGETAPDVIVGYGAANLSRRDMSSIVAGFQSRSYEMVATFVWTKAAAALKKQVATLGMEFVGEMLGRPDLNDDSDPATSIADHEVVSLAEDLAIITPTQGMRLKHALETVSHFANLSQEQSEEEEMQVEEATLILKTCISSSLGQPQFSAASQFADFRRALSERDLKTDDPDVEAVAASPYFFVRTTLSVLLSLIKLEQGAALEHAAGNIRVLLPLLWERLRGPERWQIGQAYAEVNAAGKRQASAGLKKALLEVRGFDFVPETLRSSAFTEAAARVLTAHFEYNNFYNEELPMQTLAKLGTTIPMPAFSKCMEAILAVWLGNQWGYSRSAERYATQVLRSLRPTQWEFYLNECLPRDKVILDKIYDEDKPMVRWRSLMSTFVSEDIVVKDRNIARLLESSRDKTFSSSTKKSMQNCIREIRRSDYEKK